MLRRFWGPGRSLLSGPSGLGCPLSPGPTVALKVMSLFDRQAKGMLPLLGKKAAFDNRATFEVLDWQPGVDELNRSARTRPVM